MRSGFVELVIKNRLADQSLQLGAGIRKYQPIDSFKKYISGVLPKIE